MKKWILIPWMLIPLVTLSQVDYTKFVNPFIGTGGHGHTYPGATVPFGMVQLSPDTRIDQSWDGCGGYHYDDSLIYGFSHTHLSGTGVSDFGDILLMPVSGTVSPLALLGRNYWSSYSHLHESASPGYYSVHLTEGDIDVELTATARTGFHHYTFNNKNEDANLILDLVHRDKLLNGTIYKISPTRIAGLRQSEGWARNQVILFVMDFSQPFEDAQAYNGPVFEEKVPVSGTNTRICLRFKNTGSLYVKVALSPVTLEGAIKNMDTENPGWDFEKIKKAAHDAWQTALAKIEVSGGTVNQFRIFYTALYHCLVVPNLAMDVDSMYRGRDFQSHQASGYTYYSVFSLWDTFRAWHPLMTIIDRNRTNDFIHTFLAQYEQGGRLPVWELASNETECMIGYHAVSVISDAVCKGIGNFDKQKALEAMEKSARAEFRYGLGAYMNHGFLSVEDEPESVSKTLEYAYDDWCIARMAQLMGKPEEEKEFMNRSQSWKNIFDPRTGFMRPKRNGNWLSPFDPNEVNNHFTEANSWQYTFFVPHDIPAFINRMGGPAVFDKKLDALFTTSSMTTGREQADITGLIGQYAHGNEPSHHIAYLYNYINKPEKSQRLISRIMNEMYLDSPDGLIGNEDCGQMSAWLVMSALGLYAVAPGEARFQTGIPWFKEAQVSLENGNRFKVICDSLPGKQNYLAATVSGNPSIITSIGYADIMAGKTLFFKRTNLQAYSVPTAKIEKKDSYITVPLIEATESFKKETTVSIRSDNPAAKIFYTTGEWPAVPFKRYEGPFPIDSSSVIQAFATDSTGKKSFITKAVLHQMPHPDWTIKLHSEYKKEYTAGGPEGLIDGIRGDETWRKGYWQGYWGKDFEALLDLGHPIQVNEISAGFLQDSRAWILMPKRFIVSLSSDGITYGDPLIIENTIPDQDYTEQIKVFTAHLDAATTARFVKVQAVNYGKLPSWHMGAGGDAYIFIDEIEIK